MNMKTVVIVGVLGLAATIFSSCSRPSATDFLVGGLYSITSSAHEFRVVKIVAIKDDIVQLHLYQKQYPHRPETLDPKNLKLAPMHHGTGSFSMGSLPFHLSEFLERKPRFIMLTEVTADEQKSAVLAIRKP